MKIIRGLKYWVDSFDRLNAATQDLDVLMEFVKEGAADQKEVDLNFIEIQAGVEELELKNMKKL